MTTRAGPTTFRNTYSASAIAQRDIGAGPQSGNIMINQSSIGQDGATERRDL